jgi:hypothetical protein
MGVGGGYGDWVVGYEVHYVLEGLGRVILYISYILNKKQRLPEHEITWTIANITDVL